MFALFLCQLALIIFIWVQRDKILSSMDSAIKTVWDQRKTDRSVMDGIELSVSIFITLCVIFLAKLNQPSLLFLLKYEFTI